MQWIIKFLKYLFYSVIDLITAMLLSVITELSKIPYLGEGGSIILVYAIFFSTLLSCGVLFVVNLSKGKYRRSIYFLVIVLLMITYFITLSFGIGHKAD